MFNPEEPLAAIIRASGRDDLTVGKLMDDVVQEFRTPRLAATPTFDPGLDVPHQYIQPLKQLCGRRNDAPHESSGRCGTKRNAHECS